MLRRLPADLYRVTRKPAQTQQNPHCRTLRFAALRQCDTTPLSRTFFRAATVRERRVSSPASGPRRPSRPARCRLPALTLTPLPAAAPPVSPTPVQLPP